MINNNPIPSKDFPAKLKHSFQQKNLSGNKNKNLKIMVHIKEG